MRRAIWLTLLLCGLILSTVPAQQQGIDKLKYPQLSAFTLPVVEKAELANGLKLRLIKQDKLPMFQVTMLLKGGQAYDPADRIGLMNLMTNTLRVGGTKQHTPEQMDLLLESKGIQIGFGSGSDSLDVSVSGLIEDFDQAMALTAELIRQPTYDAAKMEEMKTRIGSNISRRNDQPGPIAEREFSKLVYGPDFAAEAVMEYAHLENIERKDLQAAHNFFFTPGSMLVGISGPLGIDEVKMVFEKHFGDWQAKSTVPPLPQQIKSAKNVRLAFAEKADLTQSYIHMGYLGDLWKAEEAPALAIFNTIFSEGFDCRLFNRVRTKEGLTYGVGGSIGRNYSYPGLTSYSTFTKSSSTFKAIKAMQEEMARMRTELVTAAELKDAKDYLLNSHVFKFAGPEQILMRRLNQEFYQLPADFDDKFVDRVKAVTAADVKKIAETYLHPDKMIIMVLGKEADLDDKLENWGPVKKVDYAIPPPPLKEKFPEFTPESLKQGQAMLATATNQAYKQYAKTVKSTRSTMEVVLTTPQGQMQMKVVESKRYPGYSHQSMEIMGMKMAMVSTPKGGYMSQMGQKQSIPADKIAEESFAEFEDLLANPSAYQIQFLKEDKLEDQAVNVLLVREASGPRWKKLFLAQKTGLLLGEEALKDSMGMGKKLTRTILGDYRQIKGLPFAHLLRVEVDGKPLMNGKVLSIEVNPVLEDSLFKLE